MDRRITVSLTTLALIAIPAALLVIHLPHAQETDLSMLYLVLAALAVLAVVHNLFAYYPSKHGKLLPQFPPLFIGLIILHFLVAVGVYFSGGLHSPFFYALLLCALIAGASFDLAPALASTAVLSLFYLSVVVTHGQLENTDIQALAYNLLFIFVFCLMANRLALELKRQEQARDEVENLGVFIRRLEKAKTEFVSLVSHELRTPLTSIQGFSELLRTRDMEKEKRKEFYRIILNETERLSRLITNLLNLSKIEAGIELNREMVSIPDLVEEDLELFQSQTDIHRLKYVGNRRIPRVYADPDRLHLVIKNLLSNAVKYSPEGGPVEVETGVRGKYVTISVTDHGVGIPHEELPHIFERFRRVENSQLKGISGSGLGLAIVKHLVELHGGKVTVHSEVGKGSTFTVFIPIKGV